MRAHRLTLTAASALAILLLAACRNAGAERTESGGRAPTPEPALDAGKLAQAAFRTNLDSTAATTTLEDRVPLLEAGFSPKPVAPTGDEAWKSTTKPQVLASGEGRSFTATIEAEGACLSQERLYGTPLVHGADGRATLSMCLGRASWVEADDARTAGSALTREAGTDGRVHYRLEKHAKVHVAVVTLARPAKPGGSATPVTAVVELYPSARGRAPIGRCLVGRFEPIPVSDQGARCKVHGFELQARRSGSGPALRVVHEGEVLAVVPFAEVSFP